MKTIYQCLVFLFLICSCRKEENKIMTKNENLVNKNLENKKKLETENECTFDSIEMQSTQYKKIKFYTENKLRGSGVIELSINENVEILNINKTLYGSILLTGNEEEPFEIKLPNVVVAREIIPDLEHKVFSLDAENPETNKDFLIIYINKEKKLINNKSNKYKFVTWEKYIKSSFIRLTSGISNCTTKEKNYYYQVLKIKRDSMQIKSISKTSCDYVDEYKDITKWIKWKNDSCKLINFSFCY